MMVNFKLKLLIYYESIFFTGFQNSISIINNVQVSTIYQKGKLHYNVQKKFPDLAIFQSGISQRGDAFLIFQSDQDVVLIGININ